MPAYVLHNYGKILHHSHISKGLRQVQNDSVNTNEFPMINLLLKIQVLAFQSDTGFNKRF
jgi:hypothetical protein